MCCGCCRCECRRSSSAFSPLSSVGFWSAITAIADDRSHPVVADVCGGPIDNCSKSSTCSGAAIVDGAITDVLCSAATVVGVPLISVNESPAERRRPQLSFDSADSAIAVAAAAAAAAADRRLWSRRRRRQLRQQQHHQLHLLDAPPTPPASRPHSPLLAVRPIRRRVRSRGHSCIDVPQRSPRRLLATDTAAADVCGLTLPPQ